jgi:hypothetical protein
MIAAKGAPLDRRETVPVGERILVSEAVAAQLCSVSKVTFRKWVAAGAIRPVDLPGSVRRNLYRRVDIEAFAADR